MSFPTNPTNGQQATVNGVVYTYADPPGVWQVSSNFVGGDLNANVINANSVVSTGNVSGTNILGSNVSVENVVATVNATIGTSLAIGSTTPSNTAGELRATNAITAYYSDRRLKTEICKIENALDRIEMLTGVIYTQNELAEQFGYNNYDEQVGLYAQDVKRAQPQAVKPAPFDIAEDGSSKSGENYLTVQYDKLVPLLVEGIKELRKEIKKLKGDD